MTGVELSQLLVTRRREANLSVEEVTHKILVAHHVDKLPVEIEQMEADANEFYIEDIMQYITSLCLDLKFAFIYSTNKQPVFLNNYEELARWITSEWWDEYKLHEYMATRSTVLHNKYTVKSIDVCDIYSSSVGIKVKDFLARLRLCEKAELQILSGEQIDQIRYPGMFVKHGKRGITAKEFAKLLVAKREEMGISTEELTDRVLKKIIYKKYPEGYKWGCDRIHPIKIPIESFGLQDASEIIERVEGSIDSMNYFMDYIEALDLKLIINCERIRKVSVLTNYKEFAYWAAIYWSNEYYFSSSDYKLLSGSDFIAGERGGKNVPQTGSINASLFFRLLKDDNAEVLIFTTKEADKYLAYKKQEYLQKLKQQNRQLKENKKKLKADEGICLLASIIVITAFCLWIYWTWSIFSSPAVLESDAWFEVGKVFGIMTLSGLGALIGVFLLIAILVLIPIAPIAYMLILAAQKIVYHCYGIHYDDNKIRFLSYINIYTKSTWK